MMLRDRLVRLGARCLEITLGLFVLGLLFAHFATREGEAAIYKAKTPSSRFLPAPVTVGITDPHTLNSICYDSTGAYSICIVSPAAMAQTLAGTGTAKLSGNILLLTDNKPTIKVSAGFLENQGTGTASVYLKTGGGFTFFKMTQVTPFVPCGCGVAPPPPVSSAKTK